VYVDTRVKVKKDPAIVAEEKFWKKVDKNGPNGCWIWQGRKLYFGHGIFWVFGKHTLTHRYSWELHNGPIPDGLFVLHNCPGGDNPACANPAHLFLGTQADNVADMVRKGRAATGERSGAFTHPHRIARGDRSGALNKPERLARGEKVGASKLTDPEIIQMRARWDAAIDKGAMAKQLASEHGISCRHINDIVRRRYWTHI
jgi:hypothetical protein